MAFDRQWLAFLEAQRHHVTLAQDSFSMRNYVRQMMSFLTASTAPASLRHLHSTRVAGVGIGIFIFFFFL
jgi:hypothetical protein